MKWLIESRRGRIRVYNVGSTPLKCHMEMIILAVKIASAHAKFSSTCELTPRKTEVTTEKVTREKGALYYSDEEWIDDREHDGFVSVVVVVVVA